MQLWSFTRFEDSCVTCNQSFPCESQFWLPYTGLFPHAFPSMHRNLCDGLSLAQKSTHVHLMVSYCLDDPPKRCRNLFLLHVYYRNDFRRNMWLQTKNVLWTNLLFLLHNQHADRLQPDRLIEIN